MNKAKFNVTHEMGEQSIEIQAYAIHWIDRVFTRGVALRSEDSGNLISHDLDPDRAEAIAMDILKAVASAKESQ
jgi:hypothetical protein